MRVFTVHTHGYRSPTIRDRLGEESKLSTTVVIFNAVLCYFIKRKFTNPTRCRRPRVDSFHLSSRYYRRYTTAKKTPLPLLRGGPSKKKKKKLYKNNIRQICIIVIFFFPKRKTFHLRRRKLKNVYLDCPTTAYNII